jgi:hypothetical protein
VRARGRGRTRSAASPPCHRPARPRSHRGRTGTRSAPSSSRISVPVTAATCRRTPISAAASSSVSTPVLRTLAGGGARHGEPVQEVQEDAPAADTSSSRTWVNPRLGPSMPAENLHHGAIDRQLPQRAAGPDPGWSRRHLMIGLREYEDFYNMHLPLPSIPGRTADTSGPLSGSAATGKRKLCRANGIAAGTAQRPAPSGTRASGRVKPSPRIQLQLQLARSRGRAGAPA